MKATIRFPLALLAAATLSACGDVPNDMAQAVFVDGIGGALQAVSGHDSDRSAPRATTTIMPAPVVTPAIVRPVAAPVVASTVVVPAPRPAPVVVVVAEPVVVPEPVVIVVAEPAPEPEPVIVVAEPVTNVEIVSWTHDEDVIEVAEESPMAVVEDTPEVVEEEVVTRVAFDASITPGGMSWADSFSIGDACYIIVTGNGLDHGIADKIVETPYGEMSVTLVAQTLGQGEGIDNADALYNTIQCGHGPDNGMWDEKPGACPGRVDLGAGGGCGEVGPKWKFDV